MLLRALAVASVAFGVLSGSVNCPRARSAWADEAADRARQDLEFGEQKVREKEKEAARGAATKAQRTQQLKREQEEQTRAQETLEDRRERERRLQELIEE